MASRIASRASSSWRSRRRGSRAHQRYRAFKVSKRFDEDISAVMLAVRFDLDGREIVSARVACGGMAATPKRAEKAERALAGANLDSPATLAPCA